MSLKDLSLDERLKGILLGASYAVPRIDESKGHGSQVIPMYIRAIKQAFADEGYSKKPNIKNMTPEELRTYRREWKRKWRAARKASGVK